MLANDKFKLDNILTGLKSNAIQVGPTSIRIEAKDGTSVTIDGASPGSFPIGHQGLISGEHLARLKTLWIAAGNAW